MPELLMTIFTGGAAGAYARYRTAVWAYGRGPAHFPWATLTVNIGGSLALGVVLSLFPTGAPMVGASAFLTAGCIGAFTTFSTFAYEALVLLERRRWRLASLYVACSLSFGIVAVWAGFTIGTAIASPQPG